MTPSSQPQPIATAAISGQVTDSQHHPIAWATVVFTGTSPPHTDIAAVTNEHGYYHYTNLIPGTYTVLVNADGCLAQTQQVKAIAGQVTQLSFCLNRQP